MMRSIRVLTPILSLLVCGCVSWHTHPLPARTVIEASPRSVRLSTARERLVVLQKPVLQNDSVFGTDVFGRRRGFALAEVTSIQAGVLNQTKTGLAVLGLLLVVGFIAFLDAMSGPWL